MKILWLTSTILPYVSERTGADSSQSKGWLEYISDKLISDTSIEFVSVYASRHRRQLYGEDENCRWYAFYSPAVPEIRCNRRRSNYFRSILEKEQPDLVHIWGTEYMFDLELANAAKGIAPVVISIQGLISECARQYTYGLPESVASRYTFHDFLRKDRICDQKERYRLRGESERKLLEMSGNVIGRTDWDKRCVYDINENIRYFKCEETMRDVLYGSENWVYDKCKKHSIFMAEANYPIKGMHIALDIVKKLKSMYPDIHLYTTGRDPRCKSLKDRIRQSSYEKYISELIYKYDLDAHITYLGTLNANEMKYMYLSANVYLNASILENSSNSISEAMLLGTPIVASNVGGTASVVGKYGVECLYNIYDIDRAIELVDKVFTSEENIEKEVPCKLKRYADEKHDRDTVYIEYLNCYRELKTG